MFRKYGLMVTAMILSLEGAAITTQAEDAPPAKQPLDQAIESVDENLEKNPDNKGLQNARQRLETDQQRILEKRADRPERPMSAERPERQARPEHPNRPVRPNH